MSNQIDQALQELGVNTGGVDPVGGLSDAISQFTAQNLTPRDIMRGVDQFPRTVGGAIPEIGARIPELGRIPLPFPEVGGVLGKAIDAIPTVFLGTGGEWASTQYAYDLNRHHPKLKFLFKVGFSGFATREFYYFVQRSDKPKIRFIHQDINYYNFRTRVKTNSTFEPLSITFLDEIGNSVNEFFVEYMRLNSGQGSGGWGTNEGFGKASSSFPYPNGYSTGRLITVEQIFANGTASNRFMFINPRIETFDFDELSMEDSAGSTCTISFSYDAIKMETVAASTIYSWGQTDLLRGGGTSGVPNGGSTSGVGVGSSYSANGLGMGSGGSSITKQPDLIYESMQTGIDEISKIPRAISDMVNQGISEINPFNHQGVVGSAVDTISSSIQGTLKSIVSGENLQFNGSPDVQTYSVETPQVQVTRTL